VLDRLHTMTAAFSDFARVLHPKTNGHKALIVANHFLETDLEN
jgi:hypothetical protein